MRYIRFLIVVLAFAVLCSTFFPQLASAQAETKSKDRKIDFNGGSVKCSDSTFIPIYQESDDAYYCIGANNAKMKVIITCDSGYKAQTLDKEAITGGTGDDGLKKCVVSDTAAVDKASRRARQKSIYENKINGEPSLKERLAPVLNKHCPNDPSDKSARANCVNEFPALVYECFYTYPGHGVLAPGNSSSQSIFQQSQEESRIGSMASCIASKTGQSEIYVKNLLEGINISQLETDAQTAGDEAGDQARRQVCEHNGNTWENGTCSIAGSSDDADGEEKKSTCGDHITGVGWLLCPLLDAAVALFDGMWSAFEGLLLATEPLTENKADGSGKSQIYETWSNIRGIANALLVVVFLVIVFSQITNIGIGNYGIKKALPRLVIVAILINISFLLLQITFDLANMLGKTLDNLITSQVGAVKPELGALIVDIFMLVSTGAALGVGIAAAAAFVSGPAIAIFLAIAIVPGAIIFVAGFIALIVRLGLVQVIAVFAPIALVAYVLPNTQGLFQKWWKTFTALLFMYPLMSIYYGALKFTAFIFIGKSDPNDSIFRLMGFLMLMFGSGVVVWIAIKSNAITGKIAGSVQNALNKMTKPVTDLGMGIAKSMASAKRAEFMSRNHSDRRNPVALAGRIAQRMERNRKLREIDKANYEQAYDTSFKEGLASGAYNDQLSSIKNKVPGAQERVNEMAKSVVSVEIKNKELKIESASIDQLKKTLMEAVKSGDGNMAMAASNLLLSKRGGRGVSGFSEAINEMEKGGALSGEMSERLRGNVASSHANAMDVNPGLAGWSQGSTSTLEGNTDAYIQNLQKAAEGGKGISLDKFAKMSSDIQGRIIKESPEALSTEHIKSALDVSGSTLASLEPQVITALQNELEKR